MPAAGAVATAVMAVAVGGGMWYFFSPEYTDVGYAPVQPVPYSHELHAGQLDIDCRYCHASVEKSAAAVIPPTQTCMNCHQLVLRDSPNLAPIVESSTSKRRMRWVRIHDLPEYAYFDHSSHVNQGVGCASCHGRIDQMVVVRQVEPLSMAWCLDCHRNPGPHLRPLEEVTNMNWTPSPDPAQRQAFIESAMAQRNINPPVDCSGCHR
ncbi:MAG TPA: cytochrome c3 family protein [Acidobacteriota bacterium]|nr:cytochrome c3 family protein [Acidobacteriota bacterium]